MTEGIDNLETRLSKSGLGEGREYTVGIEEKGFQEATGNYPRYEYFEETSINRAALGSRINDIAVRGGADGVSIPYEQQGYSIPTFNQVQETASGHVIEIDDTPGNERILICHRKGAGIELKPDGSICVVSQTNTINICNGTQTVIVEGDASVVYKGNLDLNVSGDMNVSVGGNYNLDVAGNMKSHIKGYVEEIIDAYMDTFIQGYEQHFVGTTQHISVEQQINVFTDSCNMVLNTFDTKAHVIANYAKDYLIHSPTVNIFGSNGAIGGSSIDMFGSTMTAPTFIGDLNGTSTASLEANVAANQGGGNATQTLTAPTQQVNLAFDSAALVPALDVQLMDVTGSLILDVNKYNGVFFHHPTVEEIRSKFRSPDNRSIKDVFIQAGLISSTFEDELRFNTIREGTREEEITPSHPIGNIQYELESRRLKI